MFLEKGLLEKATTNKRFGQRIEKTNWHIVGKQYQGLDKIFGLGKKGVHEPLKRNKMMLKHWQIKNIINQILSTIINIVFTNPVILKYLIASLLFQDTNIY